MPLNPLAAVLIASLLVLAVRNNQEAQIVALLSEEKGFVRWLVALAVVMWIYNIAPREERPIIGGLLGLAAVAMLLQSKDAVVLIGKFIRGEIT